MRNHGAKTFLLTNSDYTYTNVSDILLFQRGDPFYTSESGIYRCQFLTYKAGPHTERFITFLMDVDP